MAYQIKSAEVWATDMPDRAGTLAQRLEALAEAGANLEFVIARRKEAGTSRAFFAPVKGRKQESAALAAGMQKAAGMYALRIEGPDRAGLGAMMTRALGEAGINMRGLSAASLGKRSVCYVAFATKDEAKKAAGVLKKAMSRR